jgi:hypothetical protein
MKARRLGQAMLAAAVLGSAGCDRPRLRTETVAMDTTPVTPRPTRKSKAEAAAAVLGSAGCDRPRLRTETVAMDTTPVTPRPTRKSKAEAAAAARSAKAGPARHRGTAAAAGAPAGRDTLAATPRPPQVYADSITGLLRRELSHMADAQEAHFGLYRSYARRLELLRLQHVSPRGVVLRVVSGTADGWSGRATHGGLTGKSCVIYVGEVELKPRTDAQLLQPKAPDQPVCDR